MYNNNVQYDHVCLSSINLFYFINKGNYKIYIFLPGILPTPSKGFEEFVSKVDTYLTKPPFKYPNPLEKTGGTRMVSKKYYDN